KGRVRPIAANIKRERRRDISQAGARDPLGDARHRVRCRVRGLPVPPGLVLRKENGVLPTPGGNFQDARNRRKYLSQHRKDWLAIALRRWRMLSDGHRPTLA